MESECLLGILSSEVSQLETNLKFLLKEKKRIEEQSEHINNQIKFYENKMWLLVGRIKSIQGVDNVQTSQ